MAPTCQHCHLPLFQTGGTWYHASTHSVHCRLQTATPTED